MIILLIFVLNNVHEREKIIMNDKALVHNICLGLTTKMFSC